MTESFGWLDIELIGELLAEHHPQRDPVRIGFVELKKLVATMPGFVEDPKHPCNEKILEHIQAAWIMEKSNTPRNDDED